MASSKRGMWLVGGLLGLGAVAALFALQARQEQGSGPVAAASSPEVTVYKTPT